MLRRLTGQIFSFAAAAILLPAIVFAQGPVLPVHLPFEQAVAKGNAEGLQVQRLLTEYVHKEVAEAYTVTRKVPVKVVDPTTKEERTEYRDVTEERTRTKAVIVPVSKQAVLTYAWDQLRLRDVSGKGVPVEDLKARFEKPTMLIVTTSEASLPKEYALLFKPETVILDLACVGPAALPGADAAPPLPGEAPPPAKPLDFELPAGPPPEFRLLSINAQDHFVFRTAVKRELATTRIQMKTELREHEGKKVPVCVCEPITVLESQETSHTVGFPASAVQGDTIEGSPLSDQHRAALKQREIPVLVSANGQPVAEEWLANIRPIMLLMIAPASAPPPALAPAPAPGPAPPPAPVPPGLRA